jgi:hypothetical protein
VAAALSDNMAAARIIAVSASAGGAQAAREIKRRTSAKTARRRRTPLGGGMARKAGVKNMKWRRVKAHRRQMRRGDIAEENDGGKTIRKIGRPK